MDMTVGDRIKQAREAQGMSRPELARAAGIPYATLAGIENGDQQSSTAIPAIALALNVSAIWLATGRGQMKRSEVNAESKNISHKEHALQSQPLSFNPDILYEALTLLVHDEDQAGPYAPREQAERLFELIRRVSEDGGRLTKAHNNEFVEEIRARAKGAESDRSTRRNGKPARKR